MQNFDFNTIFTPDYIVLSNILEWQNTNIFSPEYNVVFPKSSGESYTERKVLDHIDDRNNGWRQWGGYNNKFPKCNYAVEGQRVVVGCVALSHAQILRFWEYPEKYIKSDPDKMVVYNGYHYVAPYDYSENQFYNWSEMPHNPSLTNVPEKIQKLLYDVSVSSGIKWGCSGSSGKIYHSTEENALDAMVENFGISSEMLYIDVKSWADTYSFSREFGISTMDLVKKQIDSGLPVVFSLDADTHAVSGHGYKKHVKNGKVTKWEARISLAGTFWWDVENVWKTMKESDGYQVNMNFYPDNFCGFKNNDFRAVNSSDINCNESVEIEGNFYPNDSVGLTIDKCPNVFNPGQFIKYWCPDDGENKDGLCDSVKKEDIIRDDCTRDHVCIRYSNGKCKAPANADGEWDSTFYRPCKNKSMKECIDLPEFQKVLYKNGKRYILYKLYDQIYDSETITELSLSKSVLESRFSLFPGYYIFDFVQMNYSNPYDSMLYGNLCTSRQYELDSPEFFENCIELKNGIVPECENQCEFTYSRPIYDNFDCPPCLKKKSVMDKLNPVRSSKRRDVSESEWNSTDNFKMCKDMDGDEHCDDEEFKVCGIDEYDWLDVCKNPEKHRVRPVDGGHAFLIDNCPKVYNPETYNENKGVWEQADWNNDNIGDACDFDGDGIEDDVDPRVYSAQGGTEKLNFEDPRSGYTNNKNCGGSSMVGHCFGDGWFGRTLNINGFIGIKDPKKSKSKIEAKFCYCGNLDTQHGKCKESGDCGRNHVRTGRFWDSTGKPTWRTAHEDEKFTEEVTVDRYSTGIYYNEDKKKAPQIDTGMKKAGFSWDWGYSKNSILSKVPEVAAESGMIKDIIKWSGNYPAIRISFAPVNKISEPYAVADGVNIKRYENYYQEATPGQLGSTIEYAFSDLGMIDLIIEKRATGGSAWWLPSLPPNWWYLIDHFRPGLADFRPMPGDPWEWNSSIGSAEEVLLRPEVLTSAVLNEKGMILKALKNDSPYQQIFKMGAADFIYSYENSEHVIKMANDAGFFQKKAVVENGIDMKSASVLVDGNKIYMAGNLTGSSGQYAAAGENYNYNNVFGVIDFSTTGAVMTTLSTPASNNSSYLKLIMLDNVIFMITENETGAVDVFRYLNGEEENETWEFVTSWQLNSPVALNNGTVKDNVFYLPVPKDQNKTEIVSFNGTEFGSFQTINKAYDAYLKLYNNTGVLTAVDTKYLTDDTVPAFTITAEGVSEIEIPVIKSSMVLSTPEFCIYENNGSIFPGARNSKGECIPVYNYNYHTVSYLDYKLTIAGYANSFYLGGLTGVRRVEIRDDGSLVNRDMLYTGETNNLAVYGSTMYGANYGEIDVYSIADNGSISRTRGISSSSCGNVRVYDDKLYTAENKRVRIFDLTDPQNPLLVKTVTTAGKVIDLEVIGEQLYIYEETTSWFTTKGFTGIYDISDLNSPVRTKYFEKRCTDAEMQSSGDFVYLGCKNGQHRITDTGLVPVIGEKNFVREGFVHDRILYQVFSGALHKSKVAVKTAVCGDGLIENDEICDSDIISCTELSSSYVSGIAACNSTCSGYNESVCETDGW